MIKSVIWLLAVMTLLSDLFLVFIALSFVLYKLKITRWFRTIRAFFTPYTASLAFLVTLTATLGSLFFSEVAKFQPCVLCWYQRIFMYPQPIILYTGIIRNEHVMRPYLRVLSVVGALIAAYHYVLQVLPRALSVPCSAEAGVSCVKGYTFYFGYISIPMMSLTAFSLALFFYSFPPFKQKRNA